MPVEVHHSPPPIHSPGEVTKRPKGILKNPSFSGPSGPGIGLQGRIPSPTKDEQGPYTPSQVPTDPQEARELTLQNTLQNAGPRRSSSARRASQSRRHSAAALSDLEENSDKAHLKWDEANLYLAEQDAGTRMKITEPKTPYQFGDQNAMDEDEEDDVAIDPRFVNVDEIEMAKNKIRKKPRESEIPGLELGEPEEEVGANVGAEDDRIVRGGSLSRESSKEKHVSVDESASGEQSAIQEALGTGQKHRQFEEQRKKHYEMRELKGLLGHPEDIDEMDEDDDEGDEPATGGQSSNPPVPTSLPNRSLNGER